MDRGILYIATGKNFTRELLLSAESVKKHNPGIHISAFVDYPIESEFVDQFYQIDAKHIRPKVDFIEQTPYEETIFLDTDTIIDYNIMDMFDLLDNFDLGITHCIARKRKKYSELIPEYGKIPYSFSECNTGVFVFKKNEKTLKLFSDWKKYFQKYYNVCPWDQASFRVSIWKACLEGLKMYIFPVEYNIRSKANREKNRKRHDQFGADHLTPRIYHMHVDNRINKGTYEVSSLEEALTYCKNNFMEY